jgi:hypothetical protein
MRITQVKFVHQEYLCFLVIIFDEALLHFSKPCAVRSSHVFRAIVAFLF